MKRNDREELGENTLSAELLDQVFADLLEQYGPQQWWPATHNTELIIGAILTQATAWRNAEQAIAALRTRHLLDFQRLYSTDSDTIARAIKPAGLFNAKAAKLKAFAAHLAHQHAGNLNSLLSGDAAAVRRELLTVFGIGPETADCILLYAVGAPYFVIDAYTVRLVRRLLHPHAVTGRYSGLQAMIHARTTKDVTRYREYHALIVRHGATCCLRSRPRCPTCPLLRRCGYGQQALNRANRRTPGCNGDARESPGERTTDWKSSSASDASQLPGLRG